MDPQLEAEPEPTLPHNTRASAEEPERAWRLEVDRTLGLILRRIASAEAAFVSFKGGIADIMKELKGMGRTIREDPEGRQPANTVHMQAAHGNVATSHAAEAQQGLSHNNECDMVEVVTTPNCRHNNPPAEEAEPSPADDNRPVIVDLVNTSDQSGDDNGADEFRTRTPVSEGRRVHSQPRLRVVPCAQRILGVAGTARTADTRAATSPIPTARSPRYKDPPGYDDVRDFGEGEEALYKPPLLQPKTHGVSPHPIPMTHSRGGC